MFATNMASWVLQGYFNLTKIPHCVCCSDDEDAPLCLPYSV